MLDLVPIKARHARWLRHNEGFLEFAPAADTARDVPFLVVEVENLRATLEAVYSGLQPDNWLPGPVMAQVMRAIGKGQDA